MTELSRFKAHDIRGEIIVNIEEGLACCIECAVVQHFDAKPILIRFDARETSPNRVAAAAQGAMDAGAKAL